VFRKPLPTANGRIKKRILLPPTPCTTLVPSFISQGGAVYPLRGL